MFQTVLLSCISPFLPLEECVPPLHSDRRVSSTTLARCAKGLTGCRCDMGSLLLALVVNPTCSGAADSGNIQLCPCSPRWTCPVTRWGSCAPLVRRRSSSIVPLLHLTECGEAYFTAFREVKLKQM